MCRLFLVKHNSSGDQEERCTSKLNVAAIRGLHLGSLACAVTGLLRQLRDSLDVAVLRLYR